MLSNQKLFSVGSFDFRLQHLLIICILTLAFSISFLLRVMPMGYATELFEYDPFFNFRATEYLLDNGIENYLEWNDDKSWHPTGRNISQTSQVALHVITGILYQIFNFGMSLYNFTILFPLIIGSLTSIAAFALVRVLGGTTAGLFASLMFAVSMPILVRGFAGWFKSEPLGLFLGILGLYLFVSGIKHNKGKISILKLIGAAFILALSLSSWGGSIFFILVIIIFYFGLPFFKKEKNFLIWATPIFSITFVMVSFLFERSTHTIMFYVGATIILSTLFVVVCEIVKKFSSETKQSRNCLFILGSFMLASVGIMFSGLVNLPSFRYQNAINPLLTTTDPLTDSVSEHAVTSLSSSFTLLSIFIVFGLIGIWFIFSKNSFSLKKDMKFFSLVVAFFGIYLSSAFLRLEVFASIALFILGGIGLSLFLQEIFKLRSPILKYLSSLIILSLFLVPIVLPENNNWSSWGNFAPTIISGGGHDSRHVSNDWPETMKWIKQNTPENSVVAAWWDYGYWITTLSDRTTIVDNATLNDQQIKKMAYALLADPSDSWKILYSEYDVDVASSFSSEFIDYIYYQPSNYGEPVNGMDADYIVIYATADKIASPGLELDLYVMTPGGDESKKHWLAKISNQNMDDFTENDGVTPTPNFMESTLGKLIPFELLAFVDPDTDLTHKNYKYGSVGVYGKKIQYSDPENDPFYLVYASSDFYSEFPGQKIMVFVYKINPNYQS